MAAAAYLILGIFMVAAVLSVAIEARALIGRHRGKRLVICPETSDLTFVELDAKYAAIPMAIGWPPDWRLRRCTRWPERRYCGQHCLLEIARAPETTLLRAIESTWCAGKRCARCGGLIDGIDWNRNAPSLLSPTHDPVDWDGIPPERVSEVLMTHTPLCGACSAKGAEMR